MKWRGFQQEPVPLGLAAVVLELIYILFSLLWVRVLQSPNPWVQGTDKLKEMKNLWRGLLQWDEQSITSRELYTKSPFSKRTCGSTEKKWVVQLSLGIDLLPSFAFHFILPVYHKCGWWNGHLETRCVENKAPEWPWPALTSAASLLHVLCSSFILKDVMM